MRRLDRAGILARTLSTTPRPVPLISETLPALAGWESFYVIVGGAAAALTGLQFVVMALVAESSMRGSSDTVDAFATPTIVHFCVALLVAGTLSAPWSTLDAVAIWLVVIALGGLGYQGVVIRRARRQTGYQPVFEDWVWHLILPALAYAAMLGGALALYVHDVPGLFAIGAASLLLLFIGIHNAWDTVTWLTLSRLERDRAARTEAGSSAARDDDVERSPSPEPAGAEPSATAGAR